jgi:hypothetical protein
MRNEVGPDTALDCADGGDESQRRFRYQINYTALKILQLLLDETEVSAVYCEQIEDVLLEKKDGRFVGIQVKTKQLDQAPFRSGDPAIINTLARFCVREARFPGCFESFVIATNFVFFKGDGPEDLRKILDCAKTNPALDGHGARSKHRKYFDALAHTAKVDQSLAISTLGKVSLEERMTGISHNATRALPPPKSSNLARPMVRRCWRSFVPKPSRQLSLKRKAYSAAVPSILSAPPACLPRNASSGLAKRSRAR